MSGKGSLWNWYRKILKARTALTCKKKMGKNYIVQHWQGRFPRAGNRMSAFQPLQGVHAVL